MIIDDVIWEVATCWVCGCTDEAACEGGCWWVPDDRGDLCSSCEDDLVQVDGQISQALQLGSAVELSEALAAEGLQASVSLHDERVHLPGGLDVWIGGELASPAPGVYLRREGGAWVGVGHGDGDRLEGQGLVEYLTYRAVCAARAAWAAKEVTP